MKTTRLWRRLKKRSKMMPMTICNFKMRWKRKKRMRNAWSWMITKRDLKMILNSLKIKC